MRDQIGCGGEDMAGGAVIALEPDHLGAGKIVLEAQNVVDLGAAPAVDRLVVIADAADVLEGSLLPLPVLVRSSVGEDGCGETVGVRGSLPERGLWRARLIRIAARSDFSQQAEGGC